MSEQGTHISGERETIPIVRDTTFVRFFADEAVLGVVGRELEVGFLQYGPLYVSQTELNDGERTDAKNIVTEVARMRMGQNEFLMMVMAFIRSGILEGRLNSDAVLQSLTEWAETARSERDTKESAN